MSLVLESSTLGIDVSLISVVHDFRFMRCFGFSEYRIAFSSDEAFQKFALDRIDLRQKTIYFKSFHRGLILRSNAMGKMASKYGLHCSHGTNGLGYAIQQVIIWRPEDDPLLDYKPCKVSTAAELNNEIRNILALDMVGRSDEISGTLHVHYTDEAVKRAGLVPLLKSRGVAIEWHKMESLSDH